MYIAAKVLVLIGLIRLLSETNKPFLCAGIYTGVSVIVAILLATPTQELLVGAVVSFLLASLFFWLLDRLDGSWLWWGALIGGLAIGLV